MFVSDNDSHTYADTSPSECFYSFFPNYLAFRAQKHLNAKILSQQESTLFL